MAKLTDPDSYSIAVNATATTEEVEIQTGAKTVELRIAGNLDDTSPGKTSGGTAKSAYSFLKEEWLTNATLRRFKFPIKMIFEGSFIWVNGWSPANQQTRDLFRDAGFEEQVSGNKNACMVSLGAIDNPAADLVYYTQTTGFTAATTDKDKTGEVNENIDITGKTTYYKAYLREQGKEYSEYELLIEQGLSTIGFQAYSFPLTNKNDSKVTTPDGTIDASAPYTAMELNFIKGTGFTTFANAIVYPAGAVVLDLNVQALGSTNGTWWFTPLGGTSNGANTGVDIGVTDWESYFGEEQIGAEWYAFNRELDAGTGTDIEAHEFASRQLRQIGDINDNVGISVNQAGYGTVNGKVAQLLSTYVGETLLLKPGVVIRNFDSNSTNNIKHQSITVDAGGLDSNDTPIASAEVTFPFVAAGSFIFSDNFVGEADVDTVYTAYFDFITRTSGSYTLTLSAGAIGNLTWASTDLDHIQAGDYVYLTGFVTTGAMNTLYLVDTVAANTMQITAQDGAVIITETATVQVDENPYESPGAIIVNDNAGTPMDAQITAASISWDFDYTNNNQGGRLPNTNAACTVVAIAKDGAEWIDASYTVTAATGINVPVNGGDERNYSNPA